MIISNWRIDLRKLDVSRCDTSQSKAILYPVPIRVTHNFDKDLFLHEKAIQRLRRALESIVGMIAQHLSATQIGYRLFAVIATFPNEFPETICFNTT